MKFFTYYMLMILLFSPRLISSMGTESQNKALEQCLSSLREYCPRSNVQQHSGTFFCLLHNLKDDNDFIRYWKYTRPTLIGVSKAAVFIAKQNAQHATPEYRRNLEIAYAHHEVLETFDAQTLALEKKSNS